MTFTVLLFRYIQSIILPKHKTDDMYQWPQLLCGQALFMPLNQTDRLVPAAPLALHSWAFAGKCIRSTAGLFELLCLRLQLQCAILLHPKVHDTE